MAVPETYSCDTHIETNLLAQFLNSISLLYILNAKNCVRLHVSSQSFCSHAINQQSKCSILLDTRERDLIYWEKSEHSILDFVRYTNGRFTINEPGYYYVFSQLKYEHDPESSQDTAARQTHALHHYSLRTRESKLLENSRSFSELHLEENNGTSFFGAVFRFERNDKIMIKSSHTHRISGTENENYFGLHML